MVRSIDWLKQSEAEFKAATDLLNTNNFAWCCFTAQQSAEKIDQGNSKPFPK